MNWNKFQTYDSSPEKSFEMLCNQLFDNWCKDEYKSSLVSFTIVNGSGGDGGIESLAELNDNSFVGMQAKWFRSSMTSSQINQIKKSIKTAKTIRPNILRYIVCIPRDLASNTGRGTNTESQKWDEFINKMKVLFPDLSIELWNDTRITTEMQKPSSGGIQKFWFSNSEINWDTIVYSFNKAKASWLSTKYVPNLNVTGRIQRDLNYYVGEIKNKENLVERIDVVIKLFSEFDTVSNELLSICNNRSLQLSNTLCDGRQKIKTLLDEFQKIILWLKNEDFPIPSFQIEVSNFLYDLMIRKIKNCDLYFQYFSHFSDLIRVLEKLNNTDIKSIVFEAKAYSNERCLLFLGYPGTGKTQGVAAFADELLISKFHIPIVVQARSVPENYSWKDIVLHTLGLANTWNEDELWQGLISAANRNRFLHKNLIETIQIKPKILIIIDGIDESSSHRKWIERIKESSVISKEYMQIHFCFASRPNVFSDSNSSDIINYASIVHLSPDGDVPVYKLFDTYTNAYNIKIQNYIWVKFALKTPLALKLFCEIYKGKNVSATNSSELSMNQLWRKKIKIIQEEYDSRTKVSSNDQIIFNAIVTISKIFLNNDKINRNDLISEIKKELAVDEKNIAIILECLESHGIIGSRIKKGTSLNPDEYIYYPGIQTCFEYASAILIIEKYEHPSKIKFEECNNIMQGTLYLLFIISIQKYQYLLSDNKSIESIIDPDKIFEFICYALQNADYEIAKKYKDCCLNLMRQSADNLINIVNKLVLPLSKNENHPLGVQLLDEFLNEFKTPAQRDIIWSLPEFLQNSEGKKWRKTESIDLVNNNNEEYSLKDDSSNGLPIVYAWMLSNVNNFIRQECRNKLMVWAKENPSQFYELFLHFSGVNDPQIKSDMFSILMCLVYSGAETELIKAISQWITKNILSPSKIDNNRDISIRYYAIDIIKKAVTLGIYSNEDIKDFLPPYHLSNFEITLNKDALSGSRMSGYKAIDYDLARYVLIDHFERKFNTQQHKQIKKLLTFFKKQPDFKNITSEKFILSAVYAFILKMGWNEKEFYNYEKDKFNNSIKSIDLSIRSDYSSATHGVQSSIMTVCEKYVWAARYYLSGFLCDRLTLGDNQIYITDYSLLDNFHIPAHEIEQIDSEAVFKSRSYYVPEPLMNSDKNNNLSKEHIVGSIKDSPNINWEKWIKILKKDISCNILKPNLLALKMNACFDNANGIETFLFINSLVIPCEQADDFIEEICNEDKFIKVCNPTEWDGGLYSCCSPKEVCWSLRENRYDSPYVEQFPEFSIHSSIEFFYYNDLNHGENSYSAPSLPLRKVLGITNTDGYLYFDDKNTVVAEYSRIGEKHRTEQEYVLVDFDSMIEKLKENKLQLIWIMEEYRRETSNSRERFGEFYVEKRKNCIGYYKNEDFVINRIISDFQVS